MIGVAGIAARSATARLIAGPRAGLIALIALAVCGPYFGGMFNHTKDVPFAAAMVGAIYFLLRAARDLPAPRWRDVVGFGLMLGAATGLRAMGLLLIGYAGVIVLMSLPRPVRLAETRPRSSWDRRLRLLPAFAIAYLIMIAAWPWACARSAQSVARDLLVRAFPLRDPHHRRRRDLPDGGCAVVVCSVLSRNQGSAGDLCRRARCALSLDLSLARDGLTTLPRRQMETAFIAFVAVFPMPAR